MKTSKWFYCMVILILLMTFGCSVPDTTGNTQVHVTKNPDVEEILQLNPEADIFQFEGVIYKTGIDWVEELTLTKDVQLGEIKVRNETDTHFKDEMSNKLPVGAKIFSPKEKHGPILLVEVKGEILKYYALIEG